MVSKNAEKGPQGKLAPLPIKIRFIKTLNPSLDGKGHLKVYSPVWNMTSLL